MLFIFVYFKIFCYWFYPNLAVIRTMQCLFCIVFVSVLCCSFFLFEFTEASFFYFFVGCFILCLILNNCRHCKNISFELVVCESVKKVQ